MVFENKEEEIDLKSRDKRDWIKNLLSRVPKADSEIVQLDLLGVAGVFFSFINCMHFRKLQF